MQQPASCPQQHTAPLPKSSPSLSPVPPSLGSRSPPQEAAAPWPAVRGRHAPSLPMPMPMPSHPTPPTASPSHRILRLARRRLSAVLPDASTDAAVSGCGPRTLASWRCLVDPIRPNRSANSNCEHHQRSAAEPAAQQPSREQQRVMTRRRRRRRRTSPRTSCGRSSPACRPTSR